MLYIKSILEISNINSVTPFIKQDLVLLRAYFINSGKQLPTATQLDSILKISKSLGPSQKQRISSIKILK